MNLNTLTIGELRSLISEKKTTTAEILRSLADALERDGRSEKPLNAYIRFDGEKLREEAGKVSGLEGSLIGGVPIAIKDNMNVRGTETTCASNILRGYVAPYDATAVANLKKHGGSPAGKLNMDEFAMGNSNENTAFGPVRNPHNRDLIPGGSSGGAAAAVASGLAIGALGSDTGGSIRQPASMCGVFGLKPTYGRVSRYGLVAYASSLDQIGPVTRTVMDGALLLRAVAGHDGSDSTSAREEVPDFTKEIGRGVKDMTVGIPDEYFGEGLEGEVESVVRRGIAVLQEAGARTKRVSMRYTRYAIATYYLIATAEASSNLARFDGVRYGNRSSDTDDLITMYRENRNRGFGSEVKRRIMLGTFALSSGYYDAYYLNAQRARTLILRDFQAAFEEVDLIATPVSPRVAWPIGDLIDDPLQMYLADAYTVPVNLAGLPAASVPSGTTGEGCPVGLQLIAGHFREDDIFRAAAVVERGNA